MDLRRLGNASVFVFQSNNTVAGADPYGNRCGDWVDVYPCYVPVPCIEIQPVQGPPPGNRWGDD